MIEDVVEVRAVAELAERLLVAVREPVDFGDATIATNASIGIALGSSTRATPEDVLRDVDAAMYRAKELGGDRFAIFDEAMHREALAAFRLHGDLRVALETEAFALDFLPTHRLTSGRVSGFGALVRWQRPLDGAMDPATFWRVAEETGIVHVLGRRVLEMACDTMRRWRDASPEMRRLAMSVPVSATQLRAPGFFELVRDTLTGVRLPPQALCLEVPGGVLSAEPDRTGDTLFRLRDLGVAIAIGDFGTGSASLDSIERYPVDVWKIDRSFTTRLAAPGRASTILKTVVALGRDLGIEVIAEGVADEAQRTLLIETGCTEGQGPLFSHPLDEAEAFALVSPTVASGVRPPVRPAPRG